MIVLHLSTPQEDEALHIAYQALERQECKKGKWELYIQCSACGYKRKWNGEIFDFCPNCGAEMIGEKTNETH